MSTLIAPNAPSKNLQVPRKVTGTFPSREAAKEAIHALRKAGYASVQIRILRPPAPPAIDRKGVYDDFSKYVRHLLNSKRIFVRITGPEIETAGRILHEQGGEVEVNHFYHSGHAFGSNKARAGQAETPSRLRNE